MTIEVIPIGGFTEVGKNMTAIRYNDEIILLDMGFFLPAVIDYEEGNKSRRLLSREEFIGLGALPDDTILLSFREQVKAIVLSHCHLDHIGAVPWLAKSYPHAAIIGTPYTIAVLNNAIKEDRIPLKNIRKSISPNSQIEITKKLSIELIHITHSTLQCAIVAIHTPEGTVLYANDYKFDSTPVVGKKPNVKRLKELGSNNVRCLISNSLYSNTEGKTPSEVVAKELLKEVMLGTDNSSSALFATTFASHIARLKSIYDFGRKLDRQVVFLGRSMLKYISAAERLKLVEFPHARLYAGKQIKKVLKEVEKKRSKYLVICTGGQGESNAVLSRIAKQELDFKFLQEDHVIFSNRTIPVPINIENRKILEETLKQRGVRLFKDAHVSGHCSIEDIRDLIKLTKPEFIVPTHGYHKMYDGIKNLASNMGYETGKTLHVMKNAQKISI